MYASWFLSFDLLSILLLSISIKIPEENTMPGSPMGNTSLLELEKQRRRFQGRARRAKRTIFFERDLEIRLNAASFRDQMVRHDHSSSM